MVLQARGDLSGQQCQPCLRLTQAVGTTRGWEAVGTWLWTVLGSQLHRKRGDEFCRDEIREVQVEAPSQDNKYWSFTPSPPSLCLFHP